jgi:hypothetical protein
MKMFSNLISFIKIFYKLCTLNVIYSNNIAISCIIIRHKKTFIPVNLTCNLCCQFYSNDRNFSLSEWT